MSLRDAVAFEQGADEGLLRAASTGDEPRPDDAVVLDARHAVALEIASLYLGAPGSLTADDWARLTATWSPPDIAELALQLTKYSRNKVRVSLGLDVAEGTRRFYRPAPIAVDPDRDPTKLP
jgi:hypothetical protein